MLEPSPVVFGTLSQRNVIGSSTGAKAISLRVLEFHKGLSPGLQSDADTVLYRLEKSDAEEDSNCTVYIDGTSHEISAKPASTFTGPNNYSSKPGEEPVVFIGSQCPESAESSVVEASVSENRPADRGVSQSINLADRESIPTADRWYRVLVDDELGSTQVTQFVGSIPPGRAPDHFHNYEEVLFILRGEGRMWAGKTNTPIGPGSCIYLPNGKYTVWKTPASSSWHCLVCFIRREALRLDMKPNTPKVMSKSKEQSKVVPFEVQDSMSQTRRYLGPWT